VITVVLVVVRSCPDSIFSVEGLAEFRQIHSASLVLSAPALWVAPALTGSGPRD